MMNKIKNGLTFVAGMVVGVATFVGALTAMAVYMPGGYSDRFGTDVLRDDWKKEDDDENE